MFKQYRVGLLVRNAFKAKAQSGVMATKGAQLPSIAPIIDGRIEEICLLDISGIRNDYQLKVAEQAGLALAVGEDTPPNRDGEKEQQKTEEVEDFSLMSKEELIVLVKSLQKQVKDLMNGKTNGF